MLTLIRQMICYPSLVTLRDFDYLINVYIPPLYFFLNGMPHFLESSGLLAVFMTTPVHSPRRCPPTSSSFCRIFLLSAISRLPIRGHPMQTNSSSRNRFSDRNHAAYSSVGTPVSYENTPSYDIFSIS